MRTFDTSYSGKKTFHNVAMRLEDAERNFFADLAQCWQDYKDEYNQISEDNRPSGERNLGFLHNLPCKHFHRFFLESVKLRETTYENDILLIETGYLPSYAIKKGEKISQQSTD